MRKSDACDRLRDIVAEILETDVGDVPADASFYEDLGAESLERIAITLRLENDFGVQLSAAESAGVLSVADALALLVRKGVVADGVDLVERLVGRRLAAGTGDRPAYLDPDVGEVSYARLHKAARGYAGALLAAGTPAGTRALVLADDSVATVVAVLGLWWAGCVPVPVSPLLTDREAVFIAGDCSAGVVHLDVAPERQRVLSGAFAGLTRLTGDDVREGMRTGAAGAARGPGDAPEPQLWPEGVEALVQYTSGSTGQPKGVRHSAQGIAAMLDAFGPVMGLRESDVVLSTARLPFGYGFGSSLLCPLDAGACTALIRGAVDAQVVMAAVLRTRPTVLCSVPRLYASLIEVARREDPAALAPVRRCLCAGEQCPPALEARIRTVFGADLLNCLGATEFMHIVLTTPPERSLPGSVGFPVPGITVTVRDEKGAVAPDGEEGRLHVAGPTVALGYLDRPQAQAATFADGGAYSDDVVRRTPDGAVQHLCRADDVLNLGGYKVAPGEIEDLIRATEGVADCRVVAARDADGLEQAVAYAVAEPGVETRALRRRVIAAIRGQLAGWKRPSRVEFLDELPATSTGKVAVYKLREQVVQP